MLGSDVGKRNIIKKNSDLVMCGILHVLMSCNTDFQLISVYMMH